MDQAEQKAIEQMEKAKQQYEEAEKLWEQARKYLQDILEMDRDDGTYELAVPLMAAIDQSIKDHAVAVKKNTEAMSSLTTEVKAMRLSRTPAYGTSKPSPSLTRPRLYEDDEERAARRQRVTSPPPGERETVTPAISTSRMPIAPLRFKNPRAPTVEPDQGSDIAQTPPSARSASSAREGNDNEFTGFVPTIAANSGKLGQKEQIRAFLSLCYAEPALTEGETTQFVDRMPIVKAISLKEMIVKSSSSLQNRKDGKVMCCPSLLSKRSAAIVEDENGEIKRKNCPTCKESDGDSDFCFSLEFVPGVYQGPTRKKEKFDLTEPSQVSSVNGQTNPKRYKLIRHT